MNPSQWVTANFILSTYIALVVTAILLVVIF